MSLKDILKALPLPEGDAGDGNPPPPPGRALKNWIDSLPMADCSSAADSLSRALSALLFAGYSADKQIQVLESLRGPIKQVCETLEKVYLGQAIPLARRPAEAFRHRQDLIRLMALGYRRVMCELGASDNVRFRRRKRLTLACVRSLGYLRNRLVGAYQVYGEPAQGLWRELYASWQLTLAHEVQDQAVEDAEGRYRQRPTAEQVLMQAMMLSLCNPYRLGQREVAEVSAALEVWSEECSLEPARAGSAANKPGRFVFNPTVDRGPRQTVDAAAGAASDEWILVADELARRLRDQGRKGEQHRVTLEQSVRDRILLAWGIVTPRGFRRLPARHHLEAVVGMRGVHFALAGMRDFETLVRGDLESSGQLAQWAQASDDRRLHATTHCQAVDQSFGGYRLKWDADQDIRLRVGEMVATARPVDPGEPQNWIIGVARWIRIDGGGNLEAGIELLARAAEAVIVFPNPEDRSPRSAIRGLLLEPLTRGEPDMPMLISDPSLRSAERLVVVDRRCNSDLLPGNDPRFRVKLVRCIEHTPAFAQFHYQVRQSHESPPSTG